MNSENIKWGIIIIFFIALVFLMATFFEHKSYVRLELDKCVKKESKEGFDTLDEQPMIYTKNIKIGPGNCRPYSGCFFPSNEANPVNPKTGKRPKPPMDDYLWCEKSWRDCNAYQDCVDGKCAPKSI